MKPTFLHAAVVTALFSPVAYGIYSIFNHVGSLLNDTTLPL